MFDLDSSPPDYAEPNDHPRFCFSKDLVAFQVEDTRFKVHKHFLYTYSSVFRDLLRPQHKNKNSDNGNSKSPQNGGVIYLDGVTVLEFESLLTFFYESWQERFSMPTENWVALLAIAHRFKFEDAEHRARREVFQHSPSLDPVKQIAIAEKHLVPIILIVPALEALVLRQEPLLEKELTNMSSEMIACLGVAREKHVRESSRMFVTEAYLRRAASDIVKSVWLTKDAPTTV
ncbi:hypothetical protein BJV78DRAFT_1282106 [Lactifluus subvellereus]|nr:hypothetical protein BJV78DRAFT_1282106 [Lactifluus subvellereus]